MIIGDATRSRWLTLGFGLIVSAISAWLVVRDVDLNRLRQALSAADWRWVLVAVLLLVVTFFGRVQRWRVVLRPIEYQGLAIVAAQLIGQVLNFLLPLRVGDVARSMMLGREPDSSFERALGSVAIEKAWDWIALTVMLLLVVLTTPLPDWLIGPVQSAGVIAALILIGFGVIAFAPPRFAARSVQLVERTTRWLPQRWRSAVTMRLRRLFTSLEALRDRATIGQAALWSLIIWTLGVVTNFAVMRAFGVESWLGALLLMAMLMVGTALPPSIAAVGIFEGLTILALGTFDVPHETALAIGLTLHVLVFVPQTLIAAILVVLQPATTKALKRSQL